jgi:hypothetical protein
VKEVQLRSLPKQSWRDESRHFESENHTSPEGLSGIRTTGTINPARGRPLGVDVEVGPEFGPARTASAETGAAGRGAFVEFNANRPMEDTSSWVLSPGVARRTARLLTDDPLPLAGTDPEFVRLAWWKFWIR